MGVNHKGVRENGSLECSASDELGVRILSRIEHDESRQSDGRRGEQYFVQCGAGASHRHEGQIHGRVFGCIVKDSIAIRDGANIASRRSVQIDGEHSTDVQIRCAFERQQRHRHSIIERRDIHDPSIEYVNRRR